MKREYIADELLIDRLCSICNQPFPDQNKVDVVGSGIKPQTYAHEHCFFAKEQLTKKLQSIEKQYAEDRYNLECRQKQDVEYAYCFFHKAIAET
jgi:hypothetical protein